MEGVMRTTKLIESYGRRFTSFGRIAGIITILIVGILIACNQDTERRMMDNDPGIENSTVK
jgi:hypothetical protein